MIGVEISPNPKFVFFFTRIHWRHLNRRMSGIIIFSDEIQYRVDVNIHRVSRKIFPHLFFHRSNPPLDYARFFLILGGIQFDRVFDILVVKLLPLSTHIFSGFFSLKMVSNAEVTDFPVLSFNGIIHLYLEKTSMTARRYFTPRLNLENACISTKLAAHILSIPLTKTLRFLNFLLTGLCNSRLFF